MLMFSAFFPWKSWSQHCSSEEGAIHHSALKVEPGSMEHKGSTAVVSPFSSGGKLTCGTLAMLALSWKVLGGQAADIFLKPGA